MNNEEIKELKEKIIVLQNFHRVKDKKIKTMEDRIERQNKLIAQQQDKISILEKKISKAIKKLSASVNHYKTQRENNAVTFTIKILEGSNKDGESN